MATVVDLAQTLRKSLCLLQAWACTHQLARKVTGGHDLREDAAELAVELFQRLVGDALGVALGADSLGGHADGEQVAAPLAGRRIAGGERRDGLGLVRRLRPSACALMCAAGLQARAPW